VTNSGIEVEVGKRDCRRMRREYIIVWYCDVMYCNVGGICPAVNDGTCCCSRRNIPAKYSR